MYKNFKSMKSEKVQTKIDFDKYHTKLILNLRI